MPLTENPYDSPQTEVQPDLSEIPAHIGPSTRQVVTAVLILIGMIPAAIVAFGAVCNAVIASDPSKVASIFIGIFGGAVVAAIISGLMIRWAVHLLNPKN